MTDIRFYHLQQKKIEQALPEILARALERKFRVVVKAQSAERLQALDTALWTHDPDSFLPHGTAVTGFPAEQPVWLTTEDENPNGATMLVLAGGAPPDSIAAFDLCCEIFDGTDESAVLSARERWKTYKEQGHVLSYFQQDESGKWTKK